MQARLLVLMFMEHHLDAGQTFSSQLRIQIDSEVQIMVQTDFNGWIDRQIYEQMDRQSNLKSDIHELDNLNIYLKMSDSMIPFLGL